MTTSFVSNEGNNKGVSGMTKSEFLANLRLHLHGLPGDEIDSIIQDYEQYFNEKEKSGMSETGILTELPSPEQVASTIKKERKQFRQQEKSSAGKVIIAIALIFFNITFVLGPALGIGGAIIGLYVAAISLIISPLLVVVKFIIGDRLLFELFLSFVFSGIGLLLLPLLVKGSSFYVQTIERYTRWNIRQVQGESK